MFFHIFGLEFIKYEADFVSNFGRVVEIEDICVVQIMC